MKKLFLVFFVNFVSLTSLAMENNDRSNVENIIKTLKNRVDSKELQSQTIADLTNIAKHLFGVNLAEKYETMEEQILSIHKSIKDQTNNKWLTLASDTLEVGIELLKTAAKLEAIAKEKGYTLWWRYTNGIDEDIAKQQPKSFGRTLLAGFISDGLAHFRDGMLGFDTACTYVYWANTHYFKYYFLGEQLKFVNDLENYIQKNGYSVNTEVLCTIKQFITDQIENQKRGSDIDYNEIDQFCSKEQNRINEVIINIQHDPKYDKTLQENSFIDLYNRKVKLFIIDKSRIQDAFLGSLVVLPLKVREEQKILQDDHNHYVISLDNSVFGKGEKFHPRISSQQLEKIKSRLITIYSNAQLINVQYLMEQLIQQCSIEY